MAEPHGSADLVRGYTKTFVHGMGRCATDVRTEPPRCVCGEIEFHYVSGQHVMGLDDEKMAEKDG